MAEPEEILVDAAIKIYNAGKALWGHEDGPLQIDEQHLSVHRRRVGFLIAAIHQKDLVIRVAQPPAPPTMLGKWFGRPTILRTQAAQPGNDGYAVFLPAILPPSPIPAGRMYRLGALLQAELIFRQSARYAPPKHSLARALYQLSETASSWQQLRNTAPGFMPDLETLRRALLQQRPHPTYLRPIEATVENLYRELLGVGMEQKMIPCFHTAANAREWAIQESDAYQAQHPKKFRGIRPDFLLGLLHAPDASSTPYQGDGHGERAEKNEQNAAELDRRPETREKEDGEDDANQGMWVLPADEGDEGAEDPFGMNRPTDRQIGEDVEGAAESLQDLEEARVITTPERAKEIFITDDPPESKFESDVAKDAIGIVYPEWDCRINDNHTAGARVQLRQARLGEPEWAPKVIAEHRVIFETVRRRFEGLRPRRIQVGRQRDGEDVDIDAYIEAYVNQRAGLPISDALYSATRPQRRDVAVSLLIDMSASTDAACTEDLRIIDVEKQALLLCCHALDTLGDPYAISGFSGESRSKVDVWSIKDFDDHHTENIYRRIAGLEPDNYTRAGAALRHATAELAARKESHRLLLLLSDGKPNDFDEYGGRYGVEDMRRAVLEARAIGIHVFCLTVDQHAPDYMPRIFGAFSFATLAHARELPAALVDVLKRLIQQ